MENTFISLKTSPIDVMLSVMLNFFKNSIIVPNFKRRMLNFSKNLSAVFNSFENIPWKVKISFLVKFNVKSLKKKPQWKEMYGLWDNIC